MYNLSISPKKLELNLNKLTQGKLASLIDWEKIFIISVFLLNPCLLYPSFSVFIISNLYII